eukprot:Rmarinus@m.25850
MDEWAKLRLGSLVTTTHKRFSVNVVRSRGGVFQEAEETTERLVGSLEATYPRVRFSEFVCDFVKDDNGVLWMLQVKGFKVLKKRPGSPFSPRHSPTRIIFNKAKNRRAWYDPGYTCEGDYCFKGLESQKFVSYRKDPTPSNQHIILRVREIPLTCLLYDRDERPTNDQFFLSAKVCDRCYEVYALKMFDSEGAEKGDVPVLNGDGTVNTSSTADVGNESKEASFGLHVASTMISGFSRPRSADPVFLRSPVTRECSEDPESQLLKKTQNISNELCSAPKKEYARSSGSSPSKSPSASRAMNACQEQFPSATGSEGCDKRNSGSGSPKCVTSCTSQLDVSTSCESDINSILRNTSLNDRSEIGSSEIDSLAPCVSPLRRGSANKANGSRRARDNTSRLSRLISPSPSGAIAESLSAAAIKRISEREAAVKRAVGRGFNLARPQTAVDRPHFVSHRVSAMLTQKTYVGAEGYQRRPVSSSGPHPVDRRSMDTQRACRSTGRNTTRSTARREASQHSPIGSPFVRVFLQQKNGKRICEGHGRALEYN